MTTTTPARRPVVGLLFALAGLLAALSIVFVLVHVVFGGVWLGIVVDIALALGFLFLAIGSGGGTVARIFFALAAVGWAILAIGGFVSLGVVFTIGVVLALVGSLVGGVLAMGNKLFSRAANFVFLLATIFIALVLLNQLFVYLAGTFAIIVVILYAVLLLIAGILIAIRK
jgi:hypothetical protein